MAAEARLQPGVYEARDEARPADSRLVIVSPGACHLPDDMAAGRRVFGLAAHLYALRHKGGEGIGDFATLRRFARMTATCGGRYSGINPLHHMFPSDRSRVSPYQPSDRRFVDPIYISIADLLERFPLPDAARLAQGSRAAFAALDALGHVDYKAVWEAKSPILEAAFAGFPANADFEAHVRQHGEALQRHGAFEARLAGEDETQKRIRYRAFLQWLADLQLGAAAHDTLYRDLAVGCAFDGGEFAAAPGHFASGVSIGAPPDPFSATGQVWNLPPFSPLDLERQHFAPMRAILAANMRHAAALRIDHVLGFARQFWVPRGAEGRHGSYVRFPADALIALTALESRRQRCLVVGEDLGTVPEGLRDSLAAAGILSYRVLWFEREGLGFRPPEDYPALALACLASHDLPTFKGWRAGLDIAASRALGQIADDGEAALAQQRLEEIRLLDRASGAEPGDDPLVAAHRMVARTPSLVMLVQADDLAGESEPLNVPGTDTERPNWRRRISVAVEDLAETPAAAAVLDAVRTERP